jgi:hypothetical protein
MVMRLAILMMTAVLAACAGQPSAPVPPAVMVAATPVAAAPIAPAPYVAANGGVAPTYDIDAQRRAAAKNLNLKVINKDGQELYCRSNLMTGSHIQRDTRCFTAQEVDKMQDQAQRDFKEFWTRPSYGQPAALPAGH